MIKNIKISISRAFYFSLTCYRIKSKSRGIRPHGVCLRSVTKIIWFGKFLRYVLSVGPVHEDFVVPVRISIYLSSNHYIAILALLRLCRKL